ncbi:efflux RND transporter periplasmic adaptor subunit [Rosistilla ulvae]|uniref:efflux RND transporter periplasmic adaptor subunit n=1 Tax=Rosistilla ulvae TaxID=1930277 RepID=UPI0011A32B9F|nr:HlyD family efflux transporter periplasmic adaptor subunit [Rosistilla ulvae]
MIFDELSQLAYENITPSEFYAEVLGRIASVVALRGASVWLLNGTEHSLACRIGPASEAVDASLHSLIKSTAASGEARFVVPQFLQEQQVTENPTDDLIAVAAVVDGSLRFAVILLNLPAKLDSSSQESCFRLLSIICDIAANFHRHSELNSLRTDRQRWQQIDDFASSIHRSLEPSEVFYLIANDGRAVIDCDRVLLLQNRGSKYRLEAVSGLDSVNRRSNLVRRAESLARRVAPMETTIRYPCGDEELPPQICEAIESFVDESGTSQLVVVPLIDATDIDDETDFTSEIHGVLIAENFSGQPLMMSQIDAVAKHSLSAVRNARKHRRVFLLPLWSMLGDMAWVVRVRAWPKLLVATVLMTALVLGTILVPVEFSLATEGTLEPSTRNFIFAPADGVITDLAVTHRSRVDKGDLIARVQNFDADLKLEELQGELQTTTNKLRSARASRTDATAGSLSPSQINRLAAEEEELEQWRQSLETQLELLRTQRQTLDIRTPIAGEVITWDLKNLLTARPVTQGQILMTVAKLEGPWQLELHLPDHSIGHFRQAQHDSELPLVVSFILASEPGRTLHGTVREIQDFTSLDESQRLGIRIFVDVEEQEIANLRVGAKVMGRIHCGRRSIAYVWLHELIEFVQAKILFRLS